MTPCLTALKASRPDIEIAVVSEPVASPLLEDHPLVDHLIITRQSAASRAFAIARLRKERFDVAFNMHGGSTGAILARLSGAKRSVGYRGLPLSWLLSDRTPSPDVILGRSRIHSVEQQLALLNWTGVPWPASRPHSSLIVPTSVRAKLREKLQALGGGWNEAGGFACIIPGAAFESKRWTAEGFAAVAGHLSERWSLASVVIAGPGQERLAQEVVSVAGTKSAVLAGLSLKELVALLEIARVFVGNDSGPMHMAAALDCPVVAVWGSSDPTVWHPWTEAPYRVVEAGAAKRERARQRRGDAANLEPESLAIKLITKREVIAAVDEVLELALDANRTGGVAPQAQRVKMDV